MAHHEQAVANALAHIDLYQELEDDYECSGLCQPALFYFSRPIHEGPPIRTCASKFKHILKKQAEPFAVSAMIAAFLCLGLFFLHFGLYNRPDLDGQ